MDKEIHKVHFGESKDLVGKENEIIIQKKGSKLDVHLGFLQVNHRYQIAFSIPTSLCETTSESQVIPRDTTTQSPHLKIVNFSGSKDQITFQLELFAHKDHLMIEEFTFRLSDDKTPISVLLNARVLAMEPTFTKMDQAAGKSFKMGEGDWFCMDPQCGNINFARRTKCNRCNKEKADQSQQKKKLGQAIGKAAAEKSKGLFSADDWSCNKCGNVNWARRQQCNMCNAPKWGEVEERTGYGGGYNDRGVVEYKERPDSDDEYDEFGRRKKKKSRTDEESNHEDRDKTVEDNEEEEEEEDEDDDDGDLSKYDLSDWGDLTDDKQKDKDRNERSKNHSEGKRERSRSRSPPNNRR